MEAPLAVSTPRNMNGHIPDADDLAQRVVVREEIVGDGLADHAHLGGAAHVLVGEHRPLRERPVADVEVIRRLRP